MPNIETKTIRKPKAIEGRGKRYFDTLQHFGWEATHEEDTRVKHARSHRTITMCTFIRDLDNPKNVEKKKLEEDYVKLDNSFKSYEPADPLTALLLFILLIIPGVIYLVSKSNKKREVEEYNAKTLKEMEEVLKKAQSL